MASTTDVPPNTPAPVKLSCAEAMESEMTAADQMERAKVVMQASQRMPAVGFFGSRYGERWHVDIVALPHNAVRRQLYDAYVMANALGKMVLDVSSADLARVYGWLGTLERFVVAALRAEEKFLYPLVDKLARKRRTGSDLPPMLTPSGRTEAKRQILELLSDARKTKDVSAGETASKINALRYALDQFGANILDYYGAMEKFLPGFLKERLRNGEKTKLKIEKKTVDALLSEEHGSQLVALLMQCIESRSKRSGFLSRHFKKDKAKDTFKAQVKQVQATHMQLARTFDETATKYERVFSVNTFLTHYGSNVDNKEGTLQMLGQVEINEDGEMMVTAPPDAPTELISGDIPRGMDDTVLYKTIEDDEQDTNATRDLIPGGMVEDSPDEEEYDDDSDGVAESSVEEGDSEEDEPFGDDDRFSARVPQDVHGFRR